MIFELPNDARVNTDTLASEIKAAVGPVEIRILQRAETETVIDAGKEKVIYRPFQFEIDVPKKDVSKVDAILKAHAPEHTDIEVVQKKYAEQKKQAQIADLSEALNDPALVALLKEKLGIGR